MKRYSFSIYNKEEAKQRTKAPAKKEEEKVTTSIQYLLSSMAPPIPKLVSLVLLTMVVDVMRVGATLTWCVARFDVTDQALKGPLKQACGSGADCGPIQPGGSCFNPNTTRNHASYAFNSYYQRKNRAPDTCFFRHTAMVALSDPSKLIYIQ